jgi:hypothetical protein
MTGDRGGGDAMSGGGADVLAGDAPSMILSIMVMCDARVGGDFPGTMFLDTLDCYLFNCASFWT